ERNAQRAGLFDHLHAHRRPLVRRAMMRHAGLAQARADVLEHQAEADVDALEQLHLARAQHAGVGVRKQPELERALPGPVQIFDRAAVPDASELAAIRRERALGFIAETEQRFDATLGARSLEPARNFVVAHRPRAGIAGRLAERTVVAA